MSTTIAKKAILEMRAFAALSGKHVATKWRSLKGATEQIADQVLSTLSGSLGVNFADPWALSPDQQRQLGQLQQGIAAIPFFLQKLEDKDA